ncbi:hypothetical protein KCU62_g411, partial [Aureobasidium sp. EXF-3399]
MIAEGICVYHPSVKLFAIVECRRVFQIEKVGHFLLFEIQFLGEVVDDIAPSINLLCSGLRILGNGIVRGHSEVKIVLMCGWVGLDDEQVLGGAGSDAGATGNAKLQAAATTRRVRLKTTQLIKRVDDDPTALDHDTLNASRLDSLQYIEPSDRSLVLRYLWLEHNVTSANFFQQFRILPSSLRVDNNRPRLAIQAFTTVTTDAFGDNGSWLSTVGLTMLSVHQEPETVPNPVMLQNLGWPKVLTAEFPSFLVTLPDQTHISKTSKTSAPTSTPLFAIRLQPGIPLACCSATSESNHHSVSTIDRLSLIYTDHMHLCMLVTPLYICHVVDQSKL